MGARENKFCGSMIEIGGLPCDCRMARRAEVAEVARYMIRICSRLESLRVALETVRVRQTVIAACVA